MARPRRLELAAVLALALAIGSAVPTLAAEAPTPTPGPAASPAPPGEPLRPADEPPPLLRPIDPAVRAHLRHAGTPTVGTFPAGPSWIEPGSVNRANINLSATYDVELDLAWDSRRVGVETEIAIHNTSGAAIDRVELNTFAARLGGIAIDRVEVDDRPATWNLDDQTITVQLGGVLPAGRRVEVDVAYRSTLRSNTAGSNWLFTRTNGVASLYRWIPWVSRPTAFDRPNHGDPSVTPASPRVAVTVTADRPLVVAAPGVETSTEDGGRRRSFVAWNVRDFALTAAPDYQVTTAVVDGIDVRVYSRPGDPAGTYRSQAVAALDTFADRLGPYPWTSFTLARSAGGYGMESPGMVWIPPGAGSLDYLIHHEVAHQWFYGLVGNDQASEPYADEAMADFVTRFVLGQRRTSRCGTADLDGTIYDYSDACYYEVVYIQGGNFLDDVRRQIGSTAFWNGVRAYVEANRFGLGGTKQLLDAIDAATSQDLFPTYRPRFDRYY
jgi:aminopeptidase N